MAGLIYEKDCPINDFTPEQWREIIINGCGFEPQFCPCPEAVLPLLSKDDFLTYGSHSMCTLLVLEGDWLAHLLLEDIEQEDFDNVLISSPDDFKSEEDVFKFVGARFPGNKIPDHLTWPHKGESGKK